MSDEPSPPPVTLDALAPRSARAALRWLRGGPETRRLFLLALLVRAAAAWSNPAILNDSASLLRAADRVASEGPAALLAAPHHPLPVAAFALGAAAGLPDAFATAVCVLTGALAVWPLHALARRACGRHAATAAGVLYAALPKAVGIASVPLAEGPYLLCLLGALALAAAGRDAGSRTTRRLTLAGVVGGLAYLCRPEGLLAFPGALAAGLLDGRPGRLRRAGVVAAGFVLVAVPYVALLSTDRGRLTLSPKKDVARFVGAGTPTPGAPAEPPPVPAPAASVREGPGPEEIARGTLSALDSALTVPVAVLVALGLLPPRRWRRKRARRPRLLLVGTAGLLLVLVVRLEAGWGYSGGRHALGAAALLLPFAGQGLATLAKVLRRVKSQRRMAIVCAWIIALPLAARAIVRPEAESGAAPRRLGEVIAEHVPPEGGPRTLRVATIAEPLVAFYADRALRERGVRAEDTPLWGRYARPWELGAPRGPLLDALAAELRDRDAAWVVLDVTDATGREFAAGLRERGVLGSPALGAGSALAAYPVVR